MTLEAIVSTWKLYDGEDLKDSGDLTRGLQWRLRQLISKQWMLEVDGN